MDIDLPQLVSQYGYLAVFVGALLEGESILLLAGYAANGGYLSFWVVVAVAFVGATLGDQMFFFLGRRYGGTWRERWPQFDARAQKVERLLLRWHGPVIILLRFTYGLRIAGPVAIGMTTLAPWRFMFFNAVGALIWAPLIAGVGYLFGHAMERLLGDMRRYEELGLVVLVLVAALLIGAGHLAQRRRRR
jgi:membrane protein DedA with SNARE-associated domain